MKTYKSNIKQYTLKKNETDFKKVKITTSKDAETYLRQFYFDDLEIYESFFILLLNRQNIVEGYAKISQGGTAGTVVDVKIICKYAVDSLASSVILCHNHPSGSLRTSTADLETTKKVKQALTYHDVSVIDHIILTKDEFYSFADEGCL